MNNEVIGNFSRSDSKFDFKSDVSVAEIQRRLLILGHDLGDEADSCRFGEKSAAALAAFKLSQRLPGNDSLDRMTWQALKDATLDIGERQLYLRMPHFSGRDVYMLQAALSAMGFTVATDGIFGPGSERAVRDFQQNMALVCDGIVGGATVDAILRLRHVWEGKLGVYVAGRVLGYTRAEAVLESVSVCVFGTDSHTRSIADRISNLALATTSASRLTSAADMMRPPDKDMLLVELILKDIDENADNMNESSKRKLSGVVEFVEDDSLSLRLRSAMQAMAAEDSHKLSIVIKALENLDDRKEQHYAIVILDALCLAF
ncbi:MAG: peptidoglycan-binding protein [Coriobacteriales bacterium]|nr:peptidoglycan-binding protein [Coriobacteriales bacterium]